MKSLLLVHHMAFDLCEPSSVLVKKHILNMRREVCSAIYTIHSYRLFMRILTSKVCIPYNIPYNTEQKTPPWYKVFSHAY
jgi:hypothetical protein